MRKYLALSLLLASCAPPKPRVPPEGHELSARVVGAGTSEDPVLRCGPGDSYIYMEHRFRCQDGSATGSWTRLGSRASERNTDILDIYEASCPEGKRRVVVDMYGCEEPIAERKGQRAAVTKLAVDLFENGNIQGAQARCADVFDGPHAAGDTVQCAMIFLAGDVLTGQTERAARQLQTVCAKMPAPDASQRLRASAVEEVLRWVIRGQGKSNLAREGFTAAEARLASACGVAAESVQSTRMLFELMKE